MARGARRVNLRAEAQVAAGRKVCDVTLVTVLLERWLARLEASGALIDGRPQTAARLEAWVPLLEAAAAGDDPARAELMRIAALGARNLAQEGRPASLAVAQPLLLAGAWPQPSAATEDLCHLLVRIVADAHALGTAAAKDVVHQRLLAKHAPVVPLGDRWLGYLVGPMVADVIDGLLGRLLTGAAGAGARDIAVDVGGAESPNPLFFRTLEGFSETDTGSIRRLTVTGLPRATAFERELDARRIPKTRIAVATLRDWLERRTV